jgi:hypothetical protein
LQDTVSESATYVLCDCEAIVYLTFHHLGQFFMEPSDYYDAPINKVLHFIRGVGLINKGKHNRSLKVALQGPDLWPIPHASYIHTYIQGLSWCFSFLPDTCLPRILN